jgi:peptide subunit release factor 1 (eRF1)
MKKIVVGSDIDAYCTKCKTVLAHTLVALTGGKPRRVKCNTCGGEHNYRPSKPQPKAAAVKTRKPKTAARRTRQTWDEIVKEASSRPRKTYVMSGSYNEGDWIDHGVFGLGCVQTFTPPNKITVRFSDSTRTLVCNRS